MNYANYRLGEVPLTEHIGVAHCEPVANSGDGFPATTADRNATTLPFERTKMKNCIALATLVLAAVACAPLEAQIYQQPTYPTQQYLPGQRYVPRTVTPVQRPAAPAKPQYFNINLNEAQKAQPSIGAAFYDSRGGVAVRSVYTNSPAQKAGVNSGDLITQANGKSITSAASLNAMITGAAAGSPIKLTKRNSIGKVTEVECTVTTMGKVLEASLVPEAGVYDQAVAQAQIQIKKMEKDIRNAEMELADLKKRYAKLQKDTVELKAKADQARAEEEKKKGN